MTAIPATSQGFAETVTALPNGTVDGTDVDKQQGPQSNGKGVEPAANGHGVSKKPGYPEARVSLVDRFIDEPRKVRVAVVGGGLSGILAGILLPAKVPGIDLTIYEKNSELASVTAPDPGLGTGHLLTARQGGTWLENVYPGVYPRRLSRQGMTP